MNEIPHIQDFLVKQNKLSALLIRSHLTVQDVARIYNCVGQQKY